MFLHNGASMLSRTCVKKLRLSSASTKVGNPRPFTNFCRLARMPAPKNMGLKAGCQLPQIAPNFSTPDFHPPQICDRTVFYPCHIPKFRPRNRGSEIWGSKSQGSSAEPWGFKATNFSIFGPSRIVMGLIWPDPPAAHQWSSLTRVPVLHMKTKSEI